MPTNEKTTSPPNLPAEREEAVERQPARPVWDWPEEPTEADASPTVEAARALAMVEFQAAVGKIGFAKTVHGYLGDDSVTHRDERGFIVRVRETGDEGVTNQTDPSWLDPNWNVDVLSAMPEGMAELRSTWIDGKCIRIAKAPTERGLSVDGALAFIQGVGNELEARAEASAEAPTAGAGRALKPCPFCGSDAVHLGDDPEALHIFVQCDGCGGRGPTEGSTSSGEPRAIEKWNAAWAGGNQGAPVRPDPKPYRVFWVIDVVAGDPRDAARQAQLAQEPDSLATSFVVCEEFTPIPTGVEVDLSEEA